MKKNKIAFILGTMLIVSSCFPVKAEVDITSNNSEVVSQDITSNTEQGGIEAAVEEEINNSAEQNDQTDDTTEVEEGQNVIESTDNNDVETTKEEEQTDSIDNNIEEEEQNVTESNDKNDSSSDVLEEENSNNEVTEEEENTVETENISSDNLEIINNDDGSQTITYEENISNIDESNVETIIEDKTIEQEEIKESVENQNGTYDYNINVNEEQNITEIIVPTEDKETAENLAIEHEGEVITEEHVVTQEVSETFDSLEKAQEFITNIEDNHTVIESTITVTPEQIISGVTVEQIEENGYHCIENEDGSYDIIVTGGLEEITIDLAYLSAVLEPGDSISAEIHIKNESGDEYTIESYNKEAEGPFRYIRTTRYNESMGEAVGTLMDGAYTYYVPNDIVNMHGQMHLATPADEVVKWYNEKNNTQLSYREIQNTITDDLLLEYYNEVLNKEYTSLYDAWVDNFNSRLWETKYNGQDGEEFFKALEWNNNELSFIATATVDGPGTDNMYQNSVWGYIEQIVLKVVDTIIPASYEASVVYEDTEYEYSVKYDEVEKTYAIEIKGEGNIPAVEVIIPEPTPEPEPEELTPTPELKPEEPAPEPTPEEVIPTPIPEEKPEEVIPTSPEPKEEKSSESSSHTDRIYTSEKREVTIIEEELVPLSAEPEVLGVSRPMPNSQPEVLGVNRLPQTGNSSFYYILLFIITGLTSIVIGLHLSKKFDFS